MTATENIIGLQIATCTVQSISGRHKAEKLYNVTCNRCGSTWTDLHSHLLNARYTSKYPCKMANCRLGQTGLKPNKITELKPLYIGVDEASTANHPKTRFTSATPSDGERPVPKVKVTEYERLCAARQFFDNEPLSRDTYEFIRDYKRPIYNKLLAEITAFEEN
jgi:hypothetical protein